MTKKRFQGTGTAMITPFKSDGSIDERALRRFVDFQIDGGVDMLLPCGTTGEGATLDENETDRVVQIVIEQSRRRVPVIMGAGSNSTAKAVQMTKRAKKLGVDGVLSVVSNETPDMMSTMIDAALEGNLAKARELHYKLLPLMNVNFIESNPIPVKAAVAMMGLTEENYRLPLIRINSTNREKLAQIV